MDEAKPILREFMVYSSPLSQHNNTNNVFITIADRPLQRTISNSPNICHAGQYIIIEHYWDM